MRKEITIKKLMKKYIENYCFDLVLFLIVFSESSSLYRKKFLFSVFPIIFNEF